MALVDHAFSDDDTVCHVSACGLTRSHNLHDLALGDAEVARDRVGMKNLGQLMLLNAVLG